MFMMQWRNVWIVHITDWGKMKNVMKDSLGDYIRKKTKRNPMILPIIMEV